MIKFLLFLLSFTLLFSCNQDLQELPENPCYQVECLNSQICKVKNNVATCVCNKGYTGENCEIEIDECQDNKCQNNANCIDDLAFYTCECKDGFKGDFCEVDIDECQHNDCENGSQCVDGIGYYICECKDGTFGSRCEINIDDCSNNNCQNSSECVDGINSYSCKCQEFTSGEYCEIVTNQGNCIDNQCKNDSECISQESSYTCKCQEGFSGNYCEIDDKNLNNYSLGLKHTCQIDNGKLYCWGSNEYGQLGIGNILDQSTPQQIGTDENWEQIVSNDYSNCAIKSGDLYCWGKNEFGILGIGHEVNQLSPQKVNNLVDLEDEVWEKIVINNNFACGIQSGKLFCWGNNELGQLGNGTTLNKSIPNKVNNRTNWTDIILGEKHVCGIESNKLYCWGNNEYGQVGNGNLINQTTPQEFNFLTESESNSWDKLVLGHHNSCGIKEGYLYCWGAKIVMNEGDPTCIGCGIISVPSPTLIPYKVDEDNTWTDISLGKDNFLGIKSGQLYYWGRTSANSYISDDQILWDISIPSPKLYESYGFYNYGWTKISTKNYYNLGVHQDKLYKWKTDRNFEPILVQGEFNWTSVKQNSYSCSRYKPFCKKNHICGMSNDKLLCIGDNYNGEAGIEIPNIKIPQKIEINNVSYVYLSEYQSHALKDRNLYTWGKDKELPELEEYDIDFDSFHPSVYYSYGNIYYYYYTIFNNKLYTKYDTQNTFRLVSAKPWTKISTFANKYCAITGGELFCDSLNIKFGTKDNWQDISVAKNHSCGIESGKLYCWGSNQDGQLGVELINYSNTEVQVGTKSNWQTVHTRNNFSCGIESGKLYCWGNNEYGQLGVYNRTNKSVPTQIYRGYKWTDIALGERHSCGINDGKLYCWGDNNEGQLGINNKELKTSPQQVGTREDWNKVFLGVDNTCAIARSELYCWGNNKNNQLGLGIDYDIKIPTEVIK